MPKIAYKQKRFGEAALAVIVQANRILAEYEAAGYDLTLRQLYYQFVARGFIANTDREYKKLGSIVNDARLAGYIDWDAIVDRTRYLRHVSSWDSPAAIIRGAARGYQRDLWETQPVRIEVWVEKDALVGVIERACQDLRVPFLSCRGYTSQSEMWGASQRLGGYVQAGVDVLVLHLGDHDPSGIDMSRDIEERLWFFMASDLYRLGDSDSTKDDAIARVDAAFSFKRLALNIDQVEQYDPPPNPAKLTDSRGRGYIDRHGHESWELDALEPTVIGDLIHDAVDEVRDPDRWAEAEWEEKREREGLLEAARRWPSVVRFLEGEDA